MSMTINTSLLETSVEVVYLDIVQSLSFDHIV